MSDVCPVCFGRDAHDPLCPRREGAPAQSPRVDPVPPPDEPVWHNTVDKGTWDVRVERVDGYRGVLVIKRVDTGQEIHREGVSLAYGAVFGPDAADLAVWQDRVIEVIDRQP